MKIVTSSVRSTDNQLVLRLYVAGSAPNSTRAVDNLRRICTEYAGDGYQLEIVDVLAEPLRALQDKVLVTPTLVRLSPGPVQTIFGDLSEQTVVLNALGINGQASVS